MVAAFAVAFHILAVLTPAWVKSQREAHARDFASYYYAVQVAKDGGDPYDKAELAEAARKDGTRKAVFPYFYPPPFLILMSWVLPLSLKSSYNLWFWLDELALIAVALSMWAWWRAQGPSVAVALCLAAAMLTCIPNNHLMGQANLPVLAVVVIGVWVADQPGPKRAVVGGSLVGVACMLKMSPALLVAWWLLRRRWWAVGSAILGAMGISLLTIPLMSVGDQFAFYTDVLPSFASGDYNGLALPIDLFGNHSYANFFHELFSSGRKLSFAGRVGGSVAVLTSLVVMGVAFWKEPEDDLARWGQFAAVAAALVPVPVFAYEHHLVWLIPAAVLSVVAVSQQRIHWGWGIAVGLAWAGWCVDLAELKQLWVWLDNHDHWVLAAMVREFKFVALVILWATAVQIGRSRGGGEIRE
jgi:alpha-1,2-mannosyltransferase